MRGRVETDETDELRGPSNLELVLSLSYSTTVLLPFVFMNSSHLNRKYTFMAMKCIHIIAVSSTNHAIGCGND
jgi:hypothetical protein